MLHGPQYPMLTLTFFRCCRLAAGLTEEQEEHLLRLLQQDSQGAEWHARAEVLFTDIIAAASNRASDPAPESAPKPASECSLS